MNFTQITDQMTNKQKRSARLHNARLRGSHSKIEWQKLKQEFDFRCVVCGLSDLPVEKDHIIPVYQDGSDSIENIQPSCPRCNARKGPDTTNWKQHRRKNGW